MAHLGWITALRAWWIWQPAAGNRLPHPSLFDGRDFAEITSPEIRRRHIPQQRHKVTN